MDLLKLNSCESICQGCWHGSNQERKFGGSETIRCRRFVVFILNHADLRLGVVNFMTPSAPDEKSKFWGSGWCMVARLKLKGINGWAPPGVEKGTTRSGAWAQATLGSEPSSSLPSQTKGRFFARPSSSSSSKGRFWHRPFPPPKKGPFWHAPCTHSPPAVGKLDFWQCPPPAGKRAIVTAPPFDHQKCEDPRQ